MWCLIVAIPDLCPLSYFIIAFAGKTIVFFRKRKQMMAILREFLESIDDERYALLPIQINKYRKQSTRASGSQDRKNFKGY